HRHRIHQYQGVFGDGAGGTTPIRIGSSGTNEVNISNGLNSEGAGFFDFDGDGDLDVYFDNHNYGVDILRNNYIDHTTGNKTSPKPTAATLFTHATPGTNVILGLAQSATDGDYGTCADVNDDGWVDLFMRKQNENDFYLNNGGTFTNGTDLAQANNGNKGANGLFDLDNDGDFDAVWTDNDGNRIWENLSGTWSEKTGILPNAPTSGIDGLAGGDVDNDGDIDLFLTGNNRSYLYINQINDPVLGPNTGTAFSFSLDTETFNTGDAEGATMVDIDEDGDLDIYLNVNGGNELYINDLYDASTANADKNSLYVRVWEDRANLMEAGAERFALGATIVLTDCEGNVVSGIREVNGGTGHGTQTGTRVHFGLPFGPDVDYRVLVKYTNLNDVPGGSVTREIVNQGFIPSDISAGQIIVDIYPGTNDAFCPSFPLPIECAHFDGEANQRSILLNWATDVELDNMGFRVERSQDGRNYRQIAFVDGAGNSQTIKNYYYEDADLIPGTTYYYRLIQVDFDGTEKQACDQVVINLENSLNDDNFFIFPNPTFGDAKLNLELIDEDFGTIQLKDVSGRILQTVSMNLSAGINQIDLNMNTLPAGIYIVGFQLDSGAYGIRKVIKN
ncbi:MAG: T9SS type A sorting domain-containing protein, partial [Bacteroidota bacterium]